MSTPARFVVGIDRTDEAAAAVAWAARRAAERDADVIGLTAVRRPRPGRREGDPVTFAERKLAADHALRLLGTHGVPVDRADVHIAAKDAAVALQEYTTVDDIVVVGTRGTGPIARALFGSVGDDLTRGGAAPVAVIPAGARARSSHIVVGLELSPADVEVLRWIDQSWLHRLDPDSTRITLVHVCEAPLPRPARLGITGAREPTDFQRSAAEDHIAQMVRDSVGESWARRDVNVVVLAGDPRARVAETAADADLLVIGSNHVEGLDRLLGSVAAELVHHPPCPVIIVPV